MTIRIAVIGDSPNLQTGFGTVNFELCCGFLEAGFDVHVLCLLENFRVEKGVGYKLASGLKLYPTSKFDDLGHKNFGVFLRKVRPDVIFIITDPGNVYQYIGPIVNRKKVGDWKRDGKFYTPPVVTYTPIEGSPAPMTHGASLYTVEHFGGTCVVYCETAKDVITHQFPDLHPEIVHHGLDHAPFQKYDPKDRQGLRKLVGLDDYFVIGSIGVNKRTKGFPTIIYAAQILRENKLDDGIKFYCHTNPHHSTMHGYALQEMTDYYGVSDMFLWKQEAKLMTDNYWSGVPYWSDTLKDARSIFGQTPSEPEARGYLWANYDLISKLNCFDLYLDCSQIEGWGLPVMEAMACGVPAVTVGDFHVRDELHNGASYRIDPLPPRTWDTWHSNMRLVRVDPINVAEAILAFRNDEKLRFEYGRRGRRRAKDFRWKESGEKMSQIVEATYKRYLKDWEGQPDTTSS